MEFNDTKRNGALRNNESGEKGRNDLGVKAQSSNPCFPITGDDKGTKKVKIKIKLCSTRE